MTEEKLLERVRHEYRDRGGQAKLAAELNLSRAYVSDVFRGKRPIGKDIASLLGFERVVVFRKKQQQQRVANG